MPTSARPISRFASYVTTGNDTYDRVWVERLRLASEDSASVQLRPCFSSVTLEDRYMTENELVARVLAVDKHAEIWFVRRFERLVNTIIKDLPIHAHERHEIFEQAFAILWEHDCRRLRQWQAEGRGRLASYLSPIIRRTAYDWLRKHMRTNRRTAFRMVDYIGPLPSLDMTPSRGIPMPANPTVVVDTEALAKLRDQRSAIRRAVTEMLHRDAEILRRRYYFGQSHAKIAEAMGMTIKGVGCSLNLAQKRIHNKLCLLYPELF